MKSCLLLSIFEIDESEREEEEVLFTHLDVPLDVEPQHGHGRPDLICKQHAAPWANRHSAVRGGNKRHEKSR